MILDDIIEHYSLSFQTSVRVGEPFQSLPERRKRESLVRLDKINHWSRVKSEYNPPRRPPESQYNTNITS